MADQTQKTPKTRAKRRNYELEMRNLRTYIETKLEVLNETVLNEKADLAGERLLGQKVALQGVLARMETK